MAGMTSFPARLNMKLTTVTSVHLTVIASFVILCGSGSSGLTEHFASATPTGVSCEVKAGFHVKSVIPMWEEEVVVVGCCSRNVSERGQEVHVLHLREVEEWSTPMAVTLHVRPILERSVHAGPLVLVLHSEFSVAWRIIAERLSNGTQHKIIVTKGSQLIESIGINVNVQRKDNGSIRNLLQWVSRRFKALTSYARINGANNFILKVGGAGDGEPSKCDHKSRSKVSNVVAFLQEPVPVTQRQGCVTESSKGISDRVVHVIKIHDTGRNFDDEHVPEKVTVHLGSRSRSVISKDIALILQAPLPVEWVVVSDGLQGRVDLVTEGKVHTPRMLPSQLINVRMEAFPNKSQELLMYARDWFGPTFTFTEVWHANGVRVFVDETSENPDIQQNIPEYVQKTQSAASHQPRAIGNKEVVKAHLRNGHSLRTGSETHIMLKSKGPLKASDVIRMPKVMLMESMTVECLPQHLVVAFPRLSLERLGLQPRDITLIDSDCFAVVNDTHYRISSAFHLCGTKTELDDDKLIYRNAIHFHFHVHKLTSFGAPTLAPSTNGDSFPVDDEDGEYGSGDGAAFPTVDPMEGRTLEFSCEYMAMNLKSDIKEPPIHSVSDAIKLTAEHTLFKMDLFRDPSFIRNVTADEYPFTVYEHDTLYVETHLELAPGMQVVTEKCWLSANDDPKSYSVAVLLQNMCPTDPTVQLESTFSSANNHFSFQLVPDYIAYPLLFLHCKLGICASDKLPNSRWGFKMCIDQRDYCSTESLRLHLERPHGSHHTVVTRGPFVVKQRSPSSARSPFSKVPFRSKGQLGLDVSGGETIDVRCTLPDQQSMIILGLSTEAVVGVAFASFVIGIGLSAILWCIYLKTDPLRSMHRHPPHNSGYDLSAHSGSSTPSSQSPMTA